MSERVSTVGDAATYECIGPGSREIELDLSDGMRSVDHREDAVLSTDRT